MSPIPNLIHPVDVVIEQIDTGSTHYDDDAREPIQNVNRASSITVDGQVAWTSDMEYQPDKGGPLELASGYVIFRLVDLVAAGVTIQRGDRITKLGLADSDVFIIRTALQGHYPDQGGATLLKAWFADRAPTRV